jgi:hypothetical protein
MLRNFAFVIAVLSLSVPSAAEMQFATADEAKEI